jgi:hypothetical protein
MAIFSDLLEKVMEVFMDDFFSYNKTFEDCLVLVLIKHQFYALNV